MASSPKLLSEKQSAFSSSSRKACFLAFFIALLAALLWVGRIKLFYVPTAFVDVAIHDFFSRLKGLTRTPAERDVATGQIVLLAVDSESTRAFGTYPPLPRQVFANLI